MPAYFNGKRDEESEDVLRGYGEQFIRELKQLLDTFAKWERAADAVAYLDGIDNIEFLPPGK